MQNLAFQIYRVSDNAKNFAVNVARVPNVVFEDKEKTFRELQERIAKTVRFLEGIKVSLVIYLIVSDGRVDIEIDGM